MERAQLFWFGKPPDAEQVEMVKLHKFDLVECEEGGITPDFRYARGAVFWGTDGHFAGAAACVRDHVKAAIDDGLYVVVVVPGAQDDELLAVMRDLLQEKDPHGARQSHHRELTSPVDLHQVLHQVMLHDPGAARRFDLNIKSETPIDAESAFLLQRAFHDCVSVRLEPIAPGFSGADTFIVRATLAASNAGPQPVPFFAKFGLPDSLQAELGAFRTFAEHHVPWHLRPNFIQERTTFGVARGILVGTFVENSCPLAEAVRKEANGARHIKSLFLETLGGMRHQRRNVAPGQQSVVSALKQYCKYQQVPPERCKEAAERFGGTCPDPKSLWWKLIDLPPLDWRSSAIHGDMHGENARVRKDDVIAIDYAQAAVGPACADLAHLEISLIFDGRPGDLQGDTWRQVVSELYSPEVIEASLDGSGPVGAKTWMHAAVGQVRALAPDAILEPEEYMRVLAVYLLRQACYPVNPKDAENDGYRRAFAYWLACRLAASLVERSKSKVVMA